MAENIENNGCLQRDSAEHEGYAKRLGHSIGYGKRDSVQPRLLEAILYKETTLTERIREPRQTKGARN